MLHQPIQSQSVAFVLPCLNEAQTISQCVTRACEALEILRSQYHLDGEVIVADNGSTDGSQELARIAGARVVDVPHRGYGAALIGGFAASDAEYLVMGDSDCSYDFVDAVPMIKTLMNGSDFCMGSRFKGEIKPGAMPWKNRYIGNPVLSTILRVLFRTKISDAHCGIRAIRNSAYKQLKLSSTGMEFASEMVLKSVLLNLDIAEVPVTLSPDLRGRPPHLNPWRDGLRHLIYMLMLSPSWLFMVPAAGLLSFGSFMLMALLLGGNAEMVNVAGFNVGDHWAVVSGGCIVIGVQTALFGLMALQYSYREGFRQATPLARTFLGRSRLQYWLLAGMALMFSGFVWAGSIATGWIASDYGVLNEMRGMITAFTLIMSGAQIFFGGFLMSILSGNRSRHSSVLS